jgi:hypothetical protein
MLVSINSRALQILASTSSIHQYNDSCLKIEVKANHWNVMCVLTVSGPASRYLNVEKLLLKFYLFPFPFLFEYLEISLFMDEVLIL